MRSEKTSTEWGEHLAAIRQIVDRWQAGELTTEAKRASIARENAFFHGRDRRSPATGEELCTVGGPAQALRDSQVPHGGPAHATDGSHAPNGGPAVVQAALWDDEEREPWWQR